MLRGEGFIYRSCTWIYYFMLLNLLFLISCIPVITIFPASAASFGVVRQWVKKNEPPVIPTYFKLFKENFKQSFIFGIFIFLIGTLLYADLDIILQIKSNIKTVLYLFLCLITLLYFAFVLHIFPLMVNGYYRNKQLLVNALKLSLYKFHLTLVNIICLLVLFLISLRLPFMFIFFFSVISIFITYWQVNRKFIKLEMRMNEEN